MYKWEFACGHGCMKRAGDIKRESDLAFELENLRFNVIYFHHRRAVNEHLMQLDWLRLHPFKIECIQRGSRKNSAEVLLRCAAVKACCSWEMEILEFNLIRLENIVDESDIIFSFMHNPSHVCHIEFMRRAHLLWNIHIFADRTSWNSIFLD